MAVTKSQQALIQELLKKYDKTLPQELGLDLKSNKPAPLFSWLCCSLLLSARISADIAMRAMSALLEAGWTTVHHMNESSWQARTTVLNESGYARYDEKTSTQLGKLAAKMVRDYGGDPRRLRDQAEGDPARLRQLVKEFKGIGDVGADVFMRDVQLSWPEFYPFADNKALAAAKALNLPASAASLAPMVSQEDFPRLLSALVRADQNKLEEDCDK